MLSRSLWPRTGDMGFGGAVGELNVWGWKRRTCMPLPAVGTCGEEDDDIDAAGTGDEVVFLGIGERTEVEERDTECVLGRTSDVDDQLLLELGDPVELVVCTRCADALIELESEKGFAWLFPRLGLFMIFSFYGFIYSRMRGMAI
jgi:hypothetical protein